MSKNSIIGAVVMIVVLGATFVFFTAGPENVDYDESLSAGKYDTFAQCIEGSGLKMYGSITCSHCRNQRKMFGNSFQYIKEIECDPRNEGAQTELCIEKEINATPTWILEDDNGNEIERLNAGTQKLETLAEISGCKLTEDNPDRIIDSTDVHEDGGEMIDGVEGGSTPIGN